jgi:hypothetical protein
MGLRLKSVESARIGIRLIGSNVIDMSAVLHFLEEPIFYKKTNQILFTSICDESSNHEPFPSDYFSQSTTQTNLPTNPKQATTPPRSPHSLPPALPPNFSPFQILQKF